MFRKLLKYDIQAVFKYWWIAAVITPFVSLTAGAAIQVINVDYTSYGAIQTLATFLLFMCIFALLMFLTVSQILVFIRFYKNFFSDEGYLTFTLPVKKTDLINSKLLTSFIFNIASFAVLAVNVVIMLVVGVPEEFFNTRNWKILFDIIAEILREINFYGFSYVVLGILIFCAFYIMQDLFLAVCITVGACITRKHKVLAAIGIYYGANTVLSFVIEIFSLTGIFSFVGMLSNVSEGVIELSIMLAMIIILSLLVLCVAGLYMLECYMLDRRLNLE
ncbi:MAG: hypothetical protein IJ426_01795 [Clostridia bacterium]|nr:hypothetical protein [Clostridia bacterium]